MSTLAYQDGAGQLTAADSATREIRDNIAKSRESRKPFEATWHSNMAFASGKYWLTWDRFNRQLIEDPKYLGMETYSADVITEYRMTALGELSADDDRPELLLRRDDQPTEDFQEQLNKAVSWGWDYEWLGDQAIEQIDRLIIDLGTAAVRCRWDPTYGPEVGEVPHVNGKPVYGVEEQAELVDQFQAGPIPGVEMKPVHQGRISWEVLSPFNLLIPPGVPNEHDFPWECVVRPALLSAVRKEYGDVAVDLREDTDIASTLGYDTQTQNAGERSEPGAGKGGRVKGHVWLFTYFERPCPDYPNGRTIVFASNKMKTLKMEDRLPYQAPDGSYASGISYFHWWRVTGRFWSRALVEVMKDIQRTINKRRTQQDQIIDRGLPAVFVEQNSMAKQRAGHALELIELKPQERQPTIMEGVRPGPWMAEDIQEAREDLVHATGIRGPRLGENPINVTTYAQLALLNENDQVKRQTILRDRKRGIAKLIELSVHDIRTYWGSERQIAIAGDEDLIDAFEFNAASTPTFFMVKVAKGSTKPRSQAAELKKIEDLWQAALASGAVMANPQGWVEWYRSSLEQGQALDLPEGGSSEHEDKAERENAKLIEGTVPPVQYYDLHEVHIPVHRSTQMEAEEMEDLELWMRCEEHIQSHVLQAQETARLLSQMAPPEMPPGAEMGGEAPMQGGPA